MSGMNVSGNKRTASAQKAQSAKKVVQKKKKTIAQALHDFADNNTAAVGKQGFTDLLKKINKNTVISVIQNYDNLYNTGNESDSESIVETILDETGSKESATREALIGEGDGKTSVRGIFTILLDKAKEAGVDKNSIAKYKADFIKELDKELKGSRFMRSSAKMDEIIQVVIQSIENQKALTPKQKKYVAAAPSTMQATTIKIISDRYNNAVQNFNAQLKHDGWAGDVADGLSRIWGSKNTATKVRKDLKTAQAQIRELKEASKKGKAAFEAKFKEIFGISYNAQNVAAYEQFEKTYISASIQKGIEDKFKSDFKLLLNNDVLKEEGENRYNPGKDEYEYKTTATKQQVYTREFNKLAKYVKGGKEALNKKIAESGAKTLETKYKVLQKVAAEISNKLHANTVKACGGRSFSAVEKSYQNSYKAAFGLNNNILKRVTDYNISQEKGAGIVKGAAVAIATIAVGLTTGGSGLAGVAAIAGTAGAASAAAEVSDRATSGKAIDAAKKGGLKGLLKAVNEDVDWSQLAKTSLVNGAMAIAFMGTTYAVSGLTKVAASSLGMSATATAKATVATTTLAGVAFPVGTEYALTGKITVEGVAFAVVLAVVNGAVQLVKISQLAASAKAAQAETESMIQNARKTLGIPDDAELTPEVVKQYRNAKAKALHSDRSAINGASNDLEMTLVNDAYKTLTNALKSGTVAAAKPTAPTTEPAAAQMAKDAALPAQIEGRTPAKQSSAETQIKSPEYQTLSDEITNCTNLDDLRKVIMPKMQKMTGQERIDIGFKYNKKFIELRDDLPQAAKDIQDSFLGRIFNRNSGNSGIEKLPQKIPVEVNPDAEICLGDYDLNLADPRITDALDKVADGVQITIGRGNAHAAQIGIDNAYVSAKHLAIFKNGGKLFVTDLGSSNGTTIVNKGTHSNFVQSNKKLFSGVEDYGFWQEYESKSSLHSPWKMHLYSVSESDWQKMCQVVIPILKKYDVTWKTLGATTEFSELNGDIQEGKAFTIYPKSNEEMAMIAKKLDKAIREAELERKGSHIVGDRQMGDSGRLFYRYEYNSGKYQNEVLDLNNGADKYRYRHVLYDANRGEGQYLAKDMTPADDIWLNFDPSNPNSKPGAAPAPRAAEINTPRAQRHEFVSMKKPLLAERGLEEGQMLPQHQEVVMKLDDVVLLGGDYTLKLSEFSHLKDGQSITVGREGDYRIPGDNMHVSRNHLEITRRGNDLILVDNSKNGTRFISWDIQENETAITETAFDDALDEPANAPKQTANAKNNTDNSILEIKISEEDRSFYEQLKSKRLPNYNVTDYDFELPEINEAGLNPISENDFETTSQLMTIQGLKNIAKMLYDDEKLSVGLMNHIADLDFIIRDIEDVKIKNYISEKLQKMSEMNLSKRDDAIEFYIAIKDITNVADVYNTLNGNYVRYKQHSIMPSFEDEPAIIDENLETPLTVEYLEHFREKFPKSAEKLLSENNEKTKVENIIANDFFNSQKTESLELLSHDKEMLDYMYETYYVNKMEPGYVKDTCSKIAKKYGVHVILTDLTKDIGETLYNIERELNHWKKLSKGKAKLPNILDLNICAPRFLENTAAYANIYRNIHHKGGKINDILRTLRHEIMHLNQPIYRMYSDDPEFVALVRSIMPAKTVVVNGVEKQVLDFDKCLYREELLRIGLTQGDIKYAYTNLDEFLAVCAQGDLSKCTPEFKEFLLRLGMPEYMFKMPVEDPNIELNTDIFEQIQENNPDVKDYDSLVKLIKEEKGRNMAMTSLLNGIFGKIDNNTKTKPKDGK